MSRLITSRYEYVVYDDASGALTAIPPTYPAPLDTYSWQQRQSAAGSYGVLNVGAAIGGGTQNILAPAGANLTVIAPSTNTSNVIIKNSGAGIGPIAVGGSSVSPFWTVQPGEIITFPGVWNLGSVIAFPVDTTNAAISSAAFNLQVLWSV